MAARSGLRHVDPDQRRGALYRAICRLSMTRAGACGEMIAVNRRDNRGESAR